MLNELLLAKESCTITESEILNDQIHPLDLGQIYIAKETYIWYYLIGKVLQPTTIVEIGTRFGYSLKSMVLGSKAKEIWFYDSEYDFVGSIDYVKKYFKKYFPEVIVHATKVNTRDLNRLALREKVDLVHVDAEHTIKGCYEDCLLALDAVKEGGYILIDDILDNADVKLAADSFCHDFNLIPEFLNNFRGMYVVKKNYPFMR